MATSLGDFSAEEIPQAELTFGWYGKEFRVHPDLSDTGYIDWIEETGSLEANDPKAIAAVKNFMRIVVHPDDFDDFWGIAKKHKVNQDKLAEVANRMIMAVTERPTQQSDDSQDGPSATEGSSTDASFARVIKEHEAQGRPDLALVYIEAQEARQAS